MFVNLESIEVFRLYAGSGRLFMALREAPPDVAPAVLLYVCHDSRRSNDAAAGLAVGRLGSLSALEY